MREPQAQPPSTASAIPDLGDDGSVRYALEGAVIWTALAMARALSDEHLWPGDAGFDRLAAMQSQLTKLRDQWGASA